MTRDPRTDPRVGDVIVRMIGDEPRTRKVTKVNNDQISYETPGMFVTRPLTLQAWQSWSRDAEIVRMGE